MVLRGVCAGSGWGGSIGSRCDDRRCAEQMGHMAGQFIGSAPVAGEQAYDVLSRRIKHDHRGIGTLVRKQGGKGAYRYARCADEGMRSKIFIGCRQQGADFFKGRNSRRAKTRWGEDLHAGQTGGLAVGRGGRWLGRTRGRLELTGQAPRVDRKAVCQTLRQRQGRLAERIAGKRGDSAGTVQGASLGCLSDDARRQGNGRMPLRGKNKEGNPACEVPFLLWRLKK